MNMVQINTCNFGSTGNIMLRLAEMARADGHTVYTAYPDSRDNRKKQVPQHILIGTRWGRNLHRKLAYYTGREGCFSRHATRKFLRELTRLRIDTLHLHNLHGWYINLPMLFKYIKKHDLRVIWTLHDCWSFTGHCPYFDMVNCEKWKNICNSCPIFSSYPESLADRSVYMYKGKKKWFTGVKHLTLVTPSAWLADLAKQSFLREYPVRVIYNGIDLDIFRPTESSFRERHHCLDSFLIIGVAFGWGSRKGLDVFVKLAERLDDRFRILLVGTDEAVDQQLPKRIISIHRTQNQRELAELYTTADLFVNPTREEALGMVNLEALACGTPVVTFHTGGSPETIDETCGVSVPKNDIDALEREIIRICETRPYTKEACLRRAQSFDHTARFREYMDLYREGGTRDRTAKDRA